MAKSKLMPYHFYSDEIYLPPYFGIFPKFLLKTAFIIKNSYLNLWHKYQNNGKQGKTKVRDQIEQKMVLSRTCSYCRVHLDGDFHEPVFLDCTSICVYFPSIIDRRVIINDNNITRVVTVCYHPFFIFSL